MELAVDSPLRQQMLELLEEIEGITSEIHRRAICGEPPEDRLADEASRLAAEGERMIARQTHLDAGRICTYLRSRRDRLRRILGEL